MILLSYLFNDNFALAEINLISENGLYETLSPSDVFGTGLYFLLVALHCNVMNKSQNVVFSYFVYTGEFNCF